MTNQPTPLNTGSFSNYQKRVITDYAALLDPSEAPFVEAIGGLDGGSSKFNFINRGIKFEWLEDTLSPLVGALAASADGTTTVVTVADGNMFQPGHILKVDNEYMWVKSQNGAALTVTRGFGGTTTATHSSTAVTEIIGQARLEGAESDSMGFTNFTNNYNYTQIFQREIKLTNSAPYVDVYGFTDPYEYQAAKIMPEMMRLVEKALQYGKRSTDTGNLTDTPRTMGGFEQFVTSNISSTNTVLSQSLIESTLKMAYDKGASGDFIAIINPTDYQWVKSLYDSKDFIQFGPEQTRVGMLPTQLVTAFGNVSFVLDRWQQLHKIFFIKPENLGFITLRPWTLVDIPATGDYTRKGLVGEFSFALKLEKSMAILKNFTVPSGGI